MTINTGNPLLSSAPVSLTALSGITTDLASQSLSFVPQENLPENSPQNNVLLPENISQNIIGTFPGIFLDSLLNTGTGQGLGVENAASNTIVNFNSSAANSDGIVNINPINDRVNNDSSRNVNLLERRTNQQDIFQVESFPTHVDATDTQNRQEQDVPRNIITSAISTISSEERGRGDMSLNPNDTTLGSPNIPDINMTTSPATSSGAFSVWLDARREEREMEREIDRLRAMLRNREQEYEEAIRSILIIEEGGMNSNPGPGSASSTIIRRNQIESIPSNNIMNSNDDSNGRISNAAAVQSNVTSFDDGNNLHDNSYMQTSINDIDFDDHIAPAIPFSSSNNNNTINSGSNSYHNINDNNHHYHNNDNDNNHNNNNNNNNHNNNNNNNDSNVSIEIMNINENIVNDSRLLSYESVTDDTSINTPPTPSTVDGSEVSGSASNDTGIATATTRSRDNDDNDEDEDEDRVTVANSSNNGIEDDDSVTVDSNSHISATSSSSSDGGSSDSETVMIYWDDGHDHDDSHRILVHPISSATSLFSSSTSTRHRNNATSNRNNSERSNNNYDDSNDGNNNSNRSYNNDNFSNDNNNNDRNNNNNGNSNYSDNNSNRSTSSFANSSFHLDLRCAHGTLPSPLNTAMSAAATSGSTEIEIDEYDDDDDDDVDDNIGSYGQKKSNTIQTNRNEDNLNQHNKNDFESISSGSISGERIDDYIFRSNFDITSYDENVADVNLLDDDTNKVKLGRCRGIIQKCEKIGDLNVADVVALKSPQICGVRKVEKAECDQEMAEVKAEIQEELGRNILADAESDMDTLNCMNNGENVKSKTLPAQPIFIDTSVQGSTSINIINDCTQPILVNCSSAISSSSSLPCPRSVISPSTLLSSSFSSASSSSSSFPSSSSSSNSSSFASPLRQVNQAYHSNGHLNTVTSNHSYIERNRSTNTNFPSQPQSQPQSQSQLQRTHCDINNMSNNDDLNNARRNDQIFGKSDALVSDPYANPPGEGDEENPGRKKSYENEEKSSASIKEEQEYDKYGEKICNSNLGEMVEDLERLV